MTVLITGGAGFIGFHLVERLLCQSDLAIIVLDNFNDYYDPSLKRRNVSALLGHERVTIVEGDFRDFAWCRTQLAAHRPTHVVHLGAYPGVPFSVLEPKLYVETNITGTAALLDAVREYPVERFLFASSSTVYGTGTSAPFVEDAPLGVPASPYGATKRAAEILGQTYHRRYGVPFTSLRLFNAYGPRMRPELALAVFVHNILAGKPLPLYGDGSVMRDFTHVSDICSGILAAFTAQGIAGECINLGHSEPIDMRRLISLIERATGRNAIIETHPSRPEDMPLTCADLAKARRLLGYEPQVSIEDGVREYVESVLGNSL